MNLTFNVYMRLANCASWERARQTRRRELDAMPRIYALISGVYTNMHLGFYILRRRGIVAVSTTKFITRITKRRKIMRDSFTDL